MDNVRAAGMVLAVVLAAGAGVAGEWRQFRGPNGNGLSGDAALRRDWSTRPPVVRWMLPLHDDGWGNPCVGDGKAFIVDHTNTVTGDAAAKVTAGFDVVLALDAATGREQWRSACPGATQSRYGYTGASPALDDGRLYTVSRAMRVTCFDAATGQQLWQRDGARDFGARAAEAGWGHNASPLVDGPRLIVVPGGTNAAVVALDKATGATLWQAPGSAAGYASPILYGAGTNHQVVAFIAEGLVGLRPADGARLWSLPWPVANNQNSATPLVVGSRLFITSAWGVGAALVDIAGDKPAIVWRTRELQARFSSPVCIGDAIYGTTEPQHPGRLVCLDAATGAVRWAQPGFEFGPLSAVGRTLVVVNGETGELAVVDADAPAYAELGRYRAGGAATAWNAPVIADGRLFLRTRKWLACVDVAP